MNRCRLVRLTGSFAVCTAVATVVWSPWASAGSVGASSALPSPPTPPSVAFPTFPTAPSMPFATSTTSTTSTTSATSTTGTSVAQPAAPPPATLADDTASSTSAPARPQTSSTALSTQGGAVQAVRRGQLDMLRGLVVPFTPDVVPFALVDDIDDLASLVRRELVDDASFGSAISALRARFAAALSGGELVVPPRSLGETLGQARFAGEVAASLRWIDRSAPAASNVAAAFDAVASDLAAGRNVDAATMSVAGQLLAAYLARAPRVHVDLVASDVALSGVAAALTASASPGASISAAMLRNSAASLTWVDPRAVASKSLDAVRADRLAQLAGVVSDLNEAVEPFRGDVRVDALANLAGSLAVPDAGRDALAEAYALLSLAVDVASLSLSLSLSP